MSQNYYDESRCLWWLDSSNYSCKVTKHMLMMLAWISCLYTNHELYYYIKDIVCLPSCLYIVMMTPWLTSYNKHRESAILGYMKESLSITKTGQGIKF